jgi:hypothetical protein
VHFLKPCARVTRPNVRRPERERERKRESVRERACERKFVRENPPLFI